MPPDTAVISSVDAIKERIISDLPRAVESRRGGGVFTVNFHREGNSGAYRTFGWSGQEATYIWSVQGSSGLRVPAPAEASALIVEIDFNICSGRRMPSAAVLRVFANGYPVGSTYATGWTRMRCDIPEDVISPGQPIELRFDHPCFVRMDFMDPDGDDRALGLCFYEVRLYPPWMKDVMERFSLLPAGSQLLDAIVTLSTPIDDSAKPVVYCFSSADPNHKLLGDGWMHDEQGDAWANARIASLALPAPTQRGIYFARFTLSPLLIRGLMAEQQITILLAGAVIGQFRISTDSNLAIVLPPELFEAAGMLRFSFVMPGGLPMHQFHPDQKPNFLTFLLDSITIESLPARHAQVAAVRDDDIAVPVPIAVSDRFLDQPIDELPNAVKESLGIDMAEILRHFEGLGDNCSFGLAQRKGGCEILGLLRFSNTPLKSLLIALDDEFRGVLAKNDIKLRVQDDAAGEYNLFVDRYGIRWHTNVYAGNTDEATILAQQTMRLSYLRRKFYEALHAGRKIATISRAEPRKHPIPLPYAAEPQVWEEKPERLRLGDVLPVFLSLNRYGTNTVLYLTRCAHDRRSGTVELVAPGLMRGYVDDFVIVPEVDIKDHAAWLRVAANAWLLDQGPNASFRSEPAP